jgi:multiple sugar transport system ATP-binding protein
MATIEIEGVTKRYPNGFLAVQELNLHVDDGEFMVIVGPSSCGKTTALRMVAGLEDITSGAVRFGDRVVNEVPPKDRNIAMVFQNYALYPHMTVGENIGYALRTRKVPKDEIKRRVDEAVALLGLTEWINRKPGQLSGGQRQRVAMGRAIVREPSVFLMDEPLSNLDAKLRVQMRAEVARVQRRLGTATLYVTHDQVEAMTMGDRVAVMKAGVLLQCDVPQTVYDAPCNLFVAAFIGSPSMNLFEAQMTEGAQAVVIGSQIIPLPDQVREKRPALRSFAHQKVVVGIRPEDLNTSDSYRADGQTFPEFHGVVELVEALGSDLLVYFSIDAKKVLVDSAFEHKADGETIVSAGRGGEGIARIDPHSLVTRGGAIQLFVNPLRMHFFDPVTTMSIAN